MKQVKRWMWTGACALAVVSMAFGAHAQIAMGDVVVGIVNANYPELVNALNLGNIFNRPDLTAALAIAGTTSRIWILPGTPLAWPNRPLPGALSIAGYPKPGNVPPLSTHPEDVIITGLADLTSAAYVSLEALTFTGGIRVGGNATLNRCYIRNGTGIGVECIGNTATLVNCTIYKNAGPGVAVTSGIATIDFCSIIENTGYGVVTASPAPTLVNNSILYKNNNGGVQLSGTITNDFNDIYPGTAVGNGISADPLFDTSGTWAGKVLFGSPVTDKANPLDPLLGVYPRDFKWDARVNGSRPDIGADEVSSIGAWAIPTWFSCTVDPTPVGTTPFTITVVFGEALNFPRLSGVFVVPQGGMRGNTSDWLTDPTPQPPSRNGDLVTYTCKIPALSTCAVRNGHLIDGHAVVYILLSDGSILWPRESLLPCTVTAAAATGGHFVIDTVPPVRLDANLEPAGPDSVFTANNVITLKNGPAYGAKGVPFDTTWPPATYPAYPYPAPANNQQYADLESSLWPSHAPYAPYPPVKNQPLYAFFNVGSYANDTQTHLYENGANTSDRHDGLNIGLAAQFRDLDAAKYAQMAGVAVTSDLPDEWPPYSTYRQPSGFGTDTLTSTGTLDVLNASLLPVYCDPSSGGLSATQTITATETPSDSGKVISSDWGIGISETTSQSPTVVFLARDKAGNKSPDNLNYWKAVNVPPVKWEWLRGLSGTTSPDFVNITQVLGLPAASKPSLLDQMLTPINLHDVPGTFPVLDWSVSRPGLSALQFELGPHPLYTYRLFACDEHGQAPGSSYYSPLPGDWSTWGNDEPSMSLKTADFEKIQTDLMGDPPGTLPIDNSLYDRWLVMVVAVCDEAGNVSPWPYELTYNPATHVSTWSGLLPLGGHKVQVIPAAAERGFNWRRFYIPVEANAVDTRLTANFARGTNDLGPVTIMTSSDYGRPDDLQATFTISLNVPQEDFPYSYLEVELLEDGKSVFTANVWGRLIDPSVPATGRMKDPERTVVIPRDLRDLCPNPSLRRQIELLNLDPTQTQEALCEKMRTFRLGHPDTPGVSPADGKTVDYVFRATTVWVHSVNGVDIYTRDSSPATCSYKVVRQTIEQYLETPSGKQPTKVFERE